jgi:Rho GDP-dissociation inhibitor
MSASDDSSSYQVAAKVDMRTIQEMDAEDESLVKYKQALLGSLADVSPADDPRRVVIKEMRVMFEARPEGDIVYTLDNAAAIESMKSTPFTLKEGCAYKIRVTFKVQHEIVSGLKYINTVYRKGIRVVKEEEMLGSFAPQAATHDVTFPRHGWDEAPSGMLSRGKYTAVSKFIDDDKQNHLEYEYCFAIKKDWS